MTETLIASSVLILGICLLRFLLKGRISPRIQYGMWLLVVLRLIFPWFTLLLGGAGHLSSRFSVMNAVERVWEGLMARVSSAAVMNPHAGADLFAAGKTMSHGSPLPLGDPNPVSAVSTAVPPSVSWQMILLYLWLTGAILLLLGMLWINLRFSRRLYLNRQRYGGETYGVTSLPVYCVRDLNSPCFLSYLGDKAIYLPWHMAEEGVDVRHVLIHEDCHARHHDHLWGLVRCLLLSCYWVNPLVWAAAFLSKRDCELACDDAAIRRLGEEERFDYGRTLLKLASGRRDFSRFFCASSEMNNGKKAIKERIAILAKHPRTTKAMAALLILAAVGLILVTYTGQGEKEDVAARTEAWAQAFCDRDGKALYAMYHSEHREDFYNISKVMSGPEDDYIGFGWSSPWPMGKYHFEVDGDQSVITYSALTSEPHRWVWKEWLTWEKAEGEWFVTGETSVDYDQIHTAEEFKQAYGGQIGGTPMDYGDVTEALDKLAAEDWGEDFRDPALAMEYLLNLQGGYGTVLAKDGVTTVVYTFPDKSQAAVIMEQPSGEGGAWRPVEIVPAPEEINGERMAGGGGERRGSSSTEGPRESPENPFITVEDVVKFAGITEARQVAELLQTLKMQPAQNQSGGESDSASENGALNRVESYRFSYNGEDYGLHISYMKDDGSLLYITLKRLSTGEFVNIYETPEAVEHYQITLAGEREIRQFFETHADMADYLTYRLPPELSNGGYLADLGNMGGGNLFLTSDPDGRERLEELARCVDLDFIPSTWLAAGAVERYVGDWPERIFDDGILTRVGPPWNHTAYVSDPIHYIDCQAPAVAYEVAHDLYTEATLEDAQKAYGPIPKENRSSHMWYVFFAKEGCEEMYSISLNADLYDQEDLRRIARSVYFYDSAWTQTGSAKEKK